MLLTASHITYFMLCHRKLWLFANGITMEHTSEIVSDGKLLHETSYGDRAEKYSEVEIGGIKIDFYDAKNKIIHETKRSNKAEEAHEWQLKYYIYILKQHGVDGVTGILEYTKLKQCKEIQLSGEDEHYINTIIPQIEKLIQAENCPEKIKIGLCRNCSYYDFCWSGEE
jgi:CRISPR-associated exonuclease Cas4